MSRAASKIFALGVACLCLTACITRREFVLAPDASGIVVDAATGVPATGAEVRFPGVDGIAAVTTGPDGRFALPGLTEKRLIAALPLGGVYRHATSVQASAPGRADAFASAAYIQSGKPAAAIYSVVVLMFPKDAADTPLHALTRDCVVGPVQDHAVHLSDFVSSIDPDRPPDWLGEDAAEALLEHLRLTLPSAGFQACERMNEAYSMFRASTEPLEAIQRTKYIEDLSPHLRPAPEPAN